MDHLHRIGLVDLVVALAVVVAVVGALRSGRGALGALGSALGVLVVAWLVTVVIAAWGPADVAHAVRTSHFGTTFPAPDRAVAELRHR